MATLTIGANGKSNYIADLTAETYTLTETAAPPGYATLAPFQVAVALGPETEVDVLITSSPPTSPSPSPTPSPELRSPARPSTSATTRRTTVPTTRTSGPAPRMPGGPAPHRATTARASFLASTRSPRPAPLRATPSGQAALSKPSISPLGRSARCTSVMRVLGRRPVQLGQFDGPSTGALAFTGGPSPTTYMIGAALVATGSLLFAIGHRRRRVPAHRRQR